MEKNEQENEVPEPREDAVPPGPPVSVQTPVPVKTADRLGMILRVALFSVLGGLVLFLAGMLVSFLIFTRPVQADLEAVSARLAEQEAKNEQVENDIKDLQDTKAGLEAEKIALQNSLVSNDLHIALLNTLADVMSARLALAAENDTGTRLALNNAVNSLKTLESLVQADQRVVVVALQADLESIASALSSSSASAQGDLEVMTENLMQLRESYFRQR